MKVLSYLAVAVFGLAQPSLARADVIQIDDLADHITVTDVTTGRLLASGDEPGAITFQTAATPFGCPPTVNCSRVENLLDTPGGSRSDQFILTHQQAADALVFTFLSDPALFAPGGIDVLVESGTYQTLFDGGAGPFESRTRLIIDARSDLNDPIERVPEPATLALIGSGLAGLAGIAAWRKRRDR